jgi:hypothetical protein
MQFHKLFSSFFQFLTFSLLKGLIGLDSFSQLLLFLPHPLLLVVYKSTQLVIVTVLFLVQEFLFIICFLASAIDPNLLIGLYRFRAWRVIQCKSSLFRSFLGYFTLIINEFLPLIFESLQLLGCCQFLEPQLTV